jgi:hypothetical protein
MNLITAYRILLNTDVIVDGNAPMGYCGNAGRVRRDVGRKVVSSGFGGQKCHSQCIWMKAAS